PWLTARPQNKIQRSQGEGSNTKYSLHKNAPARQQKARAIPHNSKCRYGERGAAAAKPKAQIILDVLSSILATQMPCRSRRSGA
ncbi:MAG: hypothetical protein ACLRM3_10130, partial [Subdoligranulum sp.]